MPRDTASSSTTRLSAAYAPYPSRPSHAISHGYNDHEAYARHSRPARAARPRSLAEPRDYDYDPHAAPSRSPSPFLPPPPLPSRSQNFYIPRSTTPPRARKARHDKTGAQKKVPNTFMMYKNDFRRRYPEIYSLERDPKRRMRLVARIWDIESDHVRESYEHRYRNRMLAAGRKFAEKDMKKRRKRTLNVTAIRRARKAAQGETLTERSEEILRLWILGLRRDKLIEDLHAWELKKNFPGSTSIDHKRAELLTVLTTVREEEDALADHPDQGPLDDWSLADPPVVEQYPSPTLPTPAYYPTQSVSEEEPPELSVAHVTTPVPADEQCISGIEPASQDGSPLGKFYAPPPQCGTQLAPRHDPAPSNIYASPTPSITFHEGDYSRYDPDFRQYYDPPAQSAVYSEDYSRGAVFHATGGKYHRTGDSGFHGPELTIPHSPPVSEMTAFNHTASPVDAAYAEMDAYYNATGYYYGLSEIAPAMPVETCYHLTEVSPVVARDATTVKSPAPDPALVIIGLEPTPLLVTQTSPHSATPDSICYGLVASPGFSDDVPSFTVAEEPRQTSPGVGLKPLSDNPWFGAPADDYISSQLDPRLLDYY